MRFLDTLLYIFLKYFVKDLLFTRFTNFEVIFCLNSSKSANCLFLKWLTFQICSHYRVSDSAFSFSQKRQNQWTLMHILALRPSETAWTGQKFNSRFVRKSVMHILKLDTALGPRVAEI
jgi:hypothetical protein